MLSLINDKTLTNIEPKYDGSGSSCWICRPKQDLYGPPRQAPQEYGVVRFRNFSHFIRCYPSRRTYEQLTIFSSSVYISLFIDTNLAKLPNQLWLASCSPTDLISKYKRYLHGPSSGIPGDRMERRSPRRPVLLPLRRRALC